MNAMPNHVGHRAPIPERPAPRTIGHRCEDSLGQDVYVGGLVRTWCSHGWDWWEVPKPPVMTAERLAQLTAVACQCGCGEMIEAGRRNGAPRYRRECAKRVAKERESSRKRKRYKALRDRARRALTVRTGEGQWSKTPKALGGPVGG